MRRPHARDERRLRARVEHVGRVPGDVRVAVLGRAPRDGVHLEAALEQRRERAAADEAARAGDEDPAHGA